jgi:hypothetical protein
MYLQFCDLEAEKFDAGAFHYMVNYIGDRLHADNEVSRSNLRTLVNPASLKTHIRPREQHTEIGLFVNSSMFMFVPVTHEEGKSTVSGKESVSRPHRGSNRFYNIQQAIHTAQLRIFPELVRQHQAELLSILRTLDPATLTPESREELRRLVA